MLDRLDSFAASRLVPVGDPAWRSVLALNVLLATLGGGVAVMNAMTPGFSLLGAVLQWCLTGAVLFIATLYWLVSRHRARTRDHDTGEDIA